MTTSKNQHVRSFLQHFVIGFFLCVMFAGQAWGAVCPRYWDLRHSTGVNYLLNFQGTLGLQWGENKKNNPFASELLTINANADMRGRIGSLVLGGEADLMFSLGDSNHVQIFDLHAGIDIARSGTTYYKYILSRRYLGTYYGYRRNVSFYHTRYCNQTQGSVTQHQITAGPKFVSSRLTKGAGAQFNYRFQWLRTRSMSIMYVDVQVNYAALNLFAGAGKLEHALGGKLRLGWITGLWSSSLSLSYFADIWTLQVGVGMAFWGYTRRRRPRRRIYRRRYYRRRYRRLGEF